MPHASERLKGDRAIKAAESPMEEIFIANPSYILGTQNLRSQLDTARSGGPNRRLHYMEVAGSLLTWGFNSAWAAALNVREMLRKQEGRQLTHFLLWHADIRPVSEDSLDILIKEMKESKADVISAIVPLKDHRGLTSTARDTHFWQPERITMHEAIHVLPRTFSSPDLLLNTGYMLVDFTKPWVEHVCFTINDKIARRDSDGQWIAFCEPEDWNFSRQCHKLGLKIAATRAVVVEHFGQMSWRSDMVWGDKQDEENKTPLITGDRVCVPSD